MRHLILNGLLKGTLVCEGRGLGEGWGNRDMVAILLWG